MSDRTQPTQAEATAALEHQLGQSSVFQELLAKTREISDRMAIPAVQPMELRTFEELERWAERAARTKMVPPAYQGKPDDIILAVQMGSELGFRPMQSLHNIAVVNGRPTVYGDGMLALCQQHPLYGGVEETISGEGDERAATCSARRKGDAVKTNTFSVADAKRAGLWGKQGPWTQYPDRMLKFRARGFTLRDAFPDKLRGLISAEEAGDYEPISAAPAPRAEPTPDATPRKPTITEWLDGLEADLTKAPDAAAVDAIVARADVEKARDAFRNGARERLDAMIKTAQDRTAPITEGFFAEGERMET